jgi:hypothetical protein
MNKEKKRKKKKYLAVQNVLDKYAEVWKGQPALVMAKAAFDGKLLELNNIKFIENKDTNNKIHEVSEVEEKLIETTIEVSSRIQEYASEVRNNELYEKVNYTKSDLELSRDNILKDMCQSVLKIANENFVNLTKYKISKEKLSTYKILIEEFDNLITDPLEPVRKKHEERKSVSALILEIDKLIDDRLDKLMTVYKTTNTDFYETYRSARLIGEVRDVIIRDSGDKKDSEKYEID